eukprot:TRINITY_DN6611_c0_g1_i1.p2 TRINITY_DN6611_c0_g1~~TRINITY_DN6611_c0_g1_i1.p2  ORF type:complete len:199 (+),score=76.93 TRINITY_DN6611_c0_g1_i1:297-893(+)
MAATEGLNENAPNNGTFRSNGVDDELPNISDGDDTTVFDPSTVMWVTIRVYIGWLLLGCFTGAHWALLGCAVPQGKHFYIHMACVWLAWGIFIAFRYPLPDWSDDCPDNSTMSRDCLFDHQETKYTAFYVIHIVILVFIFTAFIAEGTQLWRWVRQALQESRCTFCCSSSTYMWTYPFALLISAVTVTIWSNLDWRIG